MGRKPVLEDKYCPPPLDDTEGSAEELLDGAMQGVKPLGGPRRVLPRRPKRKPRRRKEPESFANLVGRESLSHSAYLPGYREGGPQRQNKPLLDKLRRGEFSVQAHLDLHGFTQEEAFHALESFLIENRWKDRRCVRIIHGKGNNSAGNVPVLKRRVRQWLDQKRLSRLIVAYSSAPPRDGGTGATYVLLKRLR